MDDKLDRNTDVSAEMKKTDSPVQAVPEKVKIEIRDLDLYYGNFQALHMIIREKIFLQKIKCIVN